MSLLTETSPLKDLFEWLASVDKIDCAHFLILALIHRMLQVIISIIHTCNGGRTLQ